MADQSPTTLDPTATATFVAPRASLPHVDSAELLHVIKDTCQPGHWASRKRSVRLAEAAGGAPVVWNPWLNRGENFSQLEREVLGIEGLMPPVHEDIQIQEERIMAQLSDPHLHHLDKYIFLRSLHANNQTLFYKCLVDHIEALAPLVYTPTVAEACTNYHRLYHAPGTGIYISAFKHRGRMASVLSSWPSHNVQIAVVTDGGRILGLGDLGCNGMGIPVGKISLFCAAAGFHPEHSLPLMLDCGTDNKALINDPFYQGERRPRLQGDDLVAAVDELCESFKEVWPHALLQFEDFETSHAFQILDRHRTKMLCFNDDIQGTGAVVVSGFINGLKVQGTSPAEARIVFFGAGAAAVGVAEAIAAYLEHDGGLDRDTARRAIYLVDHQGLVAEGRGDDLAPHKKPFARKQGEFPPGMHLLHVITAVKPHALIGLSGAGPSWDVKVIDELCKHCEKPLVFPLSNPTEKAEITFEQAVHWSKGRCVFASGSPFDPVIWQDKEIIPGQANNVFIFPGMGFGAVMAKASFVKDEMFTAAAKALAACVTPDELDKGQLYPPMSRLREAEAKVAAAVARAAWECGVSHLPHKPDDWEKYCAERAWQPGVISAAGAAPASVATISKDEE